MSEDYSFRVKNDFKVNINIRWGDADDEVILKGDERNIPTSIGETLFWSGTSTSNSTRAPATRTRHRTPLTSSIPARIGANMAAPPRSRSSATSKTGKPTIPLAIRICGMRTNLRLRSAR